MKQITIEDCLSFEVHVLKEHEFYLLTKHNPHSDASTTSTTVYDDPEELLTALYNELNPTIGEKAPKSQQS